MCSFRKNFEQEAYKNIDWPTLSLLLPYSRYCYAFLGWFAVGWNRLLAWHSTRTSLCFSLSPYTLLLRLGWKAEAWFHVFLCSSLNRKAGLMAKIFIVREQTYFVVLRYFYFGGGECEWHFSLVFSLFFSSRRLTFSRPFLRKANVNYRLLLSMK